MTESGYRPHILALTTQFVMGNSIMMFPFYNDGNIFYTLILLTGLSVVFILLAHLIIKNSANNNIAFCIISLLVGISALYGAFYSLYDYICFLSDVQLPQSNIFLIFTAMLTVLIVFTASSDSAICKYCLLAAVINVSIITILFIGGIKNFEISQPKSLFEFSITTTVDTLKIFLRHFSSLAVVSMFVFFAKKETTTKTLFWGTTIGFVLIALCLVQVIFTLGTSAPAIYPYIKAVGVISSGSLFTRLDGLVYWLFFSLALIKSTICLKVICLTVKQLLFKNRSLHRI